MSGDGFLARWSRRKLAEAVAAPAAPVAAPAALPEGEELEALIRALPRLEDLTPAMDLVPFMQAWVPAELRRSAMRRMWTLDPAIRDYKGPIDFDWDFNTPGAIEGFGELVPGADPLAGLPRLSEWLDRVAVASEETSAVEPAVELAVEPAEEPPRPPISAECPASAVAEPTPAVPIDGPGRPLIARRRHGGATPT